MRLKLDENLPLDARVLLADIGHDVDSVVEEGLAGAADADVVSATSREGRLLLTLDRGLGDLRSFAAGSHTGWWCSDSTTNRCPPYSRL